MLALAMGEMGASAMTTLSSFTATVYVAALSVGVSLITWVVLWTARSRSVHLWALGGIGSGAWVALTLWGNPRQALPTWAYFALVATVGFGAALCKPLAILLLEKPRVSATRVALLLGANVVVATVIGAVSGPGRPWFSWYLGLAMVAPFLLATVWSLRLGLRRRLPMATLLGLTTGVATLATLASLAAAVATGAEVFQEGDAPYSPLALGLSSFIAVCNSALFIGVVLDLAVRRATEAEARFRALAVASPVGIFQADPDGNNLFMNPAMERIMGVTARSARGKGWMESVHPEDRERVLQEWMAAIAAGRDFTSEYRFLGPSGSARWVRGYGSAVKDAAGANTGYMAVVVDVTDQRALEQRLAVASRLAAMGTLVAGVAHEINNPMTGIVAGLGTAMRDLRSSLEKLQRGERPGPEVLAERDAEVLEVLEDASQAAATITRIVRDLAVFGAPSQVRTRVSPADVVAGAMRWLPAHVRGVATVTVEDLGAPDVEASRGQLEQVLVNLVTNAARATRPGTTGEIVVRIGTAPAGAARVEVIDHGTGIEPAHLGKIFDPFFTTRPAGEGRGTGLGLAICHAIVADHGGTITVETEVGKGSTFRIELPPAPAGA